MDAALQRALKHPLSGREVHELTGLNVYGYEELRALSLDEALAGREGFIILVRSAPQFGHWCLVVVAPGGLEFFDSYSGYPEDGRESLDREWLEESGQGGSWLSRLMLESPFSAFQYNAGPLQSRDRQTMTCGRHVVCRYWFRRLPVDDYVRWLRVEAEKAGLSTDELVCLLTAVPGDSAALLSAGCACSS